MTDMPTIREFPHDREMWQIDWLGAVEQSGHEPKIAVHLSHLPYADGRSAPASVQAVGSKRVLPIGIGQLPYLCAGSRWRDGRRTQFFSEDSRSARFKNVLFDERTIRRVSLHHVIGERTGRDGKTQNLWLVPPYAYSIPPGLGKTRCFAIEYEGDPYGIVVPAHEVARFYYGQSSDLALAMFRGTLAVAPREVWDRDRCSIGMVDGRRLAVVARAKRMAKNDCWVLGRILGDENARRGAYAIYDSLLRSSANRERCFVDTDIPFRGVANWTARAVKISGTGSQPRWLVLEILSCSGAFPFDDLAVIADNDNRPDPSGRPSDEKLVAFPDMHVAVPKKDDDELRSDGPPSAGVRQISLLHPGGCFEALQGKVILDPPPKLETRYRSSESWSTAEGLVDLATGLGTHGESGIKPAEVVTDMDGQKSSEAGETEDAVSEKARNEALRATFENLAEVVDELAAMEGVAAQIRKSKQVAWIPLIAEPHKRQWSWLASAEQQPRAVMVVDVLLPDRSACLIEFQQRAGEKCMLGVVVADGAILLTDAAIVGVLRDLAQARGVWKNIRVPHGLRISCLKHTRTSAGMFAGAIIGEITDACV